VSSRVPAARDVVIRPLSIEDVPQVAAIHVVAFREPRPEAMDRAVSELHEEIKRPWAHVRVAFVGECAVGSAVAWVVADEVHVLDVATHPAERRKGIGRALVRDLLLLARSHRAVHLYLEVRRSNVAAIALYRGEGFAAIGVRERYYADDEDAVEMALSLDASTGDVVKREDEVDLEG
jgi:[ribosomal protein S18]-alanine N-acetyltransferase